jgi:hypothetical protein
MGIHRNYANVTDEFRRKRRSKNLHNSATTMYLRAPDTGAPGANSPREFGRLLYAAVPFAFVGALELEGWLSPHPVSGG